MLSEAKDFQSVPALTPDEEKAWELYCRETAGGLDVRDFWEELSPYVQDIYLTKVRNQV